jgi:hypothetical protein
LISSQKSEYQTAYLTNYREISGKQEKEKVVQYRSFVVLAKESPKVVVVRIKVIED